MKLACISHEKNREQSCILSRDFEYVNGNIHLPINPFGLIVKGLTTTAKTGGGKHTNKVRKGQKYFTNNKIKATARIELLELQCELDRTYKLYSVI